MTGIKRSLASAAILLSLAAAPLQGQVLIGYIFSELLTTTDLQRWSAPATPRSSTAAA